MKRGRTSAAEQLLTGGTGDVNPQFLSDTAAQSAADTTTTTQIVLPIQRVSPGSQTRSTVLEILKIWVEMADLNTIAAVAETIDSMRFVLSTNNAGTTNNPFQEPRVFAMFDIQRLGAFTAGGTYAYVENNLQSRDLTDGAGHGLLIATDSIFAQVQSTGTGNTNTIAFKIYYRWKTVSLLEYIGIVQSQQ